MVDPKVRVRMYRSGLGDCFLITVTKQKKKSHVLIDCGRFQGSAFSGIEWSQIIADIEHQCGGKLDAVVVTHEHADHMGGFHDNLQAFQAMAKGELWLAWTEDPAQNVLPPEKKPLQYLRNAADELSSKPHLKQMMDNVLEILKFSPTTDREFEEVKALWPKSRTVYLDPGDVIEREWLQGIRVYVLGPPKNKTFMNRSTGIEGVDMYHKMSDSASQVERATDLRPFERSFQHSYKEAGEMASFAERWLSYEREEWRRIDDDWADGLQRLALQYDTSVNNTSLVLAFELPESEKVLLFVGDAQIGNWQSWNSVSFKKRDTTSSDTTASVTSSDLLSRVAFYKCGHHGSHNATLKKGGLEVMPKGMQVAIPTNETFAVARKPSPWCMPAEGIKEVMRLRNDEVKRADDGGLSTCYVDFNV